MRNIHGTAHTRRNVTAARAGHKVITTPFLKRRVPGSTRGVHSTPLLDEKSWTKGIRGPLLDKHTSTPICVRWEYPSGRPTHVLGSFNQGVSRHVHWGPAVSGLRCNIGRAECLTAPTLVSSGRRWQPISLSRSQVQVQVVLKFKWFSL